MSGSQSERLSPEGNERRRNKRYRVENPVPITATSGGKLYTCRIVDVSMDGVRLQFEGRIPKARVIALDHPAAGTLCGVCAWADERAMGVELQLPKRDLERLLKCISIIL